MRNSINRSEKSSIKPPIFSGRSTISCSSKGRGDLPSNRARNLPFSKTASDFDETRKRKNTELPELRLQKLDSISKYSGVSYDQTRSFSGSTYSGSADTSLVREKISFPSRESFPGRAVPPLSQTRSFSGKISGENGIFFVSTRNGSFGSKYHPPPMSASRNIRIQSQEKKPVIATSTNSFASSEKKVGKQQTTRKSLNFEAERRKPDNRRSSACCDRSEIGENKSLNTYSNCKDLGTTEVYKPYNPNPCKSGPSDVLLSAFAMSGLDLVSVSK
eukprot:GHVP01054257.1.p1 GENE.GHVP01054257.1~~GHVP01054257.1.p1  ORF type:complete len:274 (+),score=36.42 GHVP01054257.1:107-928(+)